MVLSGWFVLLLAAGAVPLVLSGEPLVLAAWVLLLLAATGVDLALAASPRSVRVLRDGAARTRLGEAVEHELTLVNEGGRTLRAIVRDGWQPTVRATPSRQRVVVPAGERRRIRERLRPIRRGVRRSEHVTVRSIGPLRLAARQATIGAEGSITVLPPFHSQRHLPSRLARLRELEGRTSVMVRGQGTEFDSLREYVRGDDVRSIDWRATARTAAPDDLMVRTWRPERDRRVVVVVDTGRNAAARIGDETRLDTAFEASLLLAALADRAGDRFDLLLFDRRMRGRVHGVTGAELLPRLVGTMADVEPELLETDWSSVPALVRAASTQRSLVVLLTTAESVAGARGLLAVLPQLCAKHLVVVATVRDPEVDRMRRERDDRSSVYRAAAAERALLEQDRFADAIGRLGGTLLTAAPQELPPALADHYLALKAAGRL
ncbi:DUF58 domain-containing protein [Arenivirga flava]|uniref:Lipoprotein n=1 Tax=Arenivirga flava TaxID=1930060 RepID=A0AA37UFF6_9MICO|nr:DUF58 domain-containing protein [Arenivirga flava]GMA27979.1 lipoprotein [Arenivirga flava]